MQLKEVEHYLQEQEFENCDLFEEQVKENRLWLENWVIKIPEYNIKIREGVYEAWNMESQEYEVDHTFYMIFDMVTDEYLYQESGSSMEVSLYNYLNLTKQCKLQYDYDGLLELRCEVHAI